MPRKGRMYAEGIPCHVIQRGNNRQVCFYAEEDYQCYLEFLGEACARYKVKLHAYVLMTNHVHMPLTPEDAAGVSTVMQSLGRRYVQYINKTYRRSGTLWEGRHKASLVDAAQYLLACHRYIEMNPVAAGMVEHPADYRWSSYSANAGYKHSKFISPHDVYTGLADGLENRTKKYRELFSSALPKDMLHQIRAAAEFSVPLGNSRFKAEVEEMLGRKVGYAKRGRPARVSKEIVKRCE